MAWVGVITNAGVQMLDQAVGGATLTFTSVKTGAGTTLDMQAATSVTTQKGTGSMTSVVETDGVRIKMKIPAATGATGYVLKQVGLFGRVGSGTEQLFALLQNTDGVDVPAADFFPDFVFNVATFVAISNTDAISVTVDTSALVSEAELESALANVVILERDFYSSASSVSCPLTSNKVYIVTSSSSAPGATGGIMDATYGALIVVSNGKYGIIHKGASISLAVQNDNLVVQSASPVSMSVIEL